jgi:hypothetical protein
VYQWGDTVRWCQQLPEEGLMLILALLLLSCVTVPYHILLSFLPCLTFCTQVCCGPLQCTMSSNAFCVFPSALLLKCLSREVPIKQHVSNVSAAWLTMSRVRHL